MRIIQRIFPRYVTRYITKLSFLTPRHAAIQWIQRTPSAGVTRPQSSADFKNEWRYTAIPHETIFLKCLTHCGRVTQICAFTLQLCRTGDEDLRFYVTTVLDGWRRFALLRHNCAGRVTQICVFTLQLCRTGDADLRFYVTTVQDWWRSFAFLTRWNSVHLQVLLSATPQGGMFPEVSHPQALLGSLVSISWKFQFTKIVSEFVINF